MWYHFSTVLEYVELIYDDDDDDYDDDDLFWSWFGNYLKHKNIRKSYFVNIYGLYRLEMYNCPLMWS